MGIETAIGLSVAAAATGIAGAAMAPGTPSGRGALPGPEEEAAYFRRTEKSLTAIDTDIEKTKTIEKDLNLRLDAAEKVANSAIPDPEDLKTLKDTTYSLAASFGGGAAEAIKNGFIDEESARTAGLIEEREGAFYAMSQKEVLDMQAAEKTGFEDTAMKNQLADERQRLESQLRTAGASPSQIQDRLNQFDRNSTAMMASRAEELRTAMTERASIRVGTAGSALGAQAGALSEAGRLRLAGREQVFSEAFRGFEANRSLLAGEENAAFTGATTLGNLAAQRGQIAQGALEARSGLRGEAGGIYKDMGQMSFSDRGKQMLESGLQGPGSLYSQTGVSRGDMGFYKDAVKAGEPTPYRDAAYRTAATQVSRA